MTPLSFDDLMFLPHHACRFVSGEGKKRTKSHHGPAMKPRGFACPSCTSCNEILVLSSRLDMSWTCYQLFKRQAALIRGMTTPRYAIMFEFGTQVTPARGC